ncbi:MAG: hypothetical protein RL758_1626 [Pseudomonadota bacterium]|jgi:hypothetical protein
MNTKSVQATGMVWYLAEDFAQVKALMKDGHALHLTHADWQRDAEQLEQRLRAQGVRVYRAVLRPAEFRDWCAARGLDVDAKGRNEFSAWFARQEYSKGR